MKCFEPLELIEMLSVSIGWKNCLLGFPALWSTWTINTSKCHWDESTVLAVLPRVGQYISEIRFSYSTGLTQFTKTFLNHISNGTLTKLETLYLDHCYASNTKFFKPPTTALFKVANTLKRLEISYNGQCFHNDRDNDDSNNKKKEDSQDNEMFMPTTRIDPVTLDALQSIISSCHQLEYIRYINPQFFDRPFSSSLRTSSTMNTNNSLCPTLKHLEIQVGYIQAHHLEHILKKCPNLRVLKWIDWNRGNDNSVLNAIRHYCPHLKCLGYNYEYDLFCGEYLFKLHDPKSSAHNCSNATTSLASQSSSVSSSSSSLKQLYTTISNTNHVLSFLNHYSDTIEEMTLSLELDHLQSLSPVHPLNQLVSLVITYVLNPVTLATLLPKLPSLQILDINDSNMGGSELINALKHVNTLKELYIRDGTDADVDDMVNLFNAYAEVSIISTSNSSIKEVNETNSDGSRNFSEEQPYGGGQLTHVSLIDCNFIEDSVLEALGNIKTLSSVTIGYAPVTTNGINAFCEQLNLLPDLCSITLSGLECVDDSTLSILRSPLTKTTSSHDISRIITLQSVRNVTKEGLDELSREQEVYVV